MLRHMHDKLSNFDANLNGNPFQNIAATFVFVLYCINSFGKFRADINLKIMFISTSSVTLEKFEV